MWWIFESFTFGFVGRLSYQNGSKCFVKSSSNTIWRNVETFIYFSSRHCSNPGRCFSSVIDTGLQCFHIQPQYLPIYYFLTLIIISFRWLFASTFSFCLLISTYFISKFWLQWNWRLASNINILRTWTMNTKFFLPDSNFIRSYASLLLSNSN